MDYSVAQKETFQISDAFNLSNLTSQQLIEMVLINDDSADMVKAKHELVNRGKDEMNIRISIKKYCKQLILESETSIKECDESLKTSKKNFLNLLSLLDRLQLEWQRHDLTLMH